MKTYDCDVSSIERVYQTLRVNLSAPQLFRSKQQSISILQICDIRALDCGGKNLRVLGVYDLATGIKTDCRLLTTKLENGHAIVKSNSH
jgi:hypothetical protein